MVKSRYKSLFSMAAGHSMVCSPAGHDESRWATAGVPPTCRGINVSWSEHEDAGAQAARGPASAGSEPQAVRLSGPRRAHHRGAAGARALPARGLGRVVCEGCEEAAIEVAIHCNGQVAITESLARDRDRRCHRDGDVGRGPGRPGPAP